MYAVCTSVKEPCTRIPRMTGEEKEYEMIDRGQSAHRRTLAAHRPSHDNFLVCTTFYAADTEDVRLVFKMHVIMQQKVWMKGGQFEELKY